MYVWEQMSLYWKVCLINGGVFTAAAVILVVTPATVSPQVTSRELTVLTVGVVLILFANAVLLRRTLLPMDRMIARLDGFDVHSPGERIPQPAAGIAASLARSFNELLDRLEQERSTSAARALEAQEHERRRVAQELHDEVGQRLTVVLLGLKRAVDLSNGEAQSELMFALDNTRAGLEEVRRVAQGLRPGVLEDLGLASAVGAMASEVSARAGVPVARALTSDLPPMNEHVELAIFRIAQEALTNAARHAGAGRITVTLTCRLGCLELTVADDGSGWEGEREREGMRGMRERALAIGGRLEIVPMRPGTCVLLKVEVAEG